MYDPEERYPLIYVPVQQRRLAYGIEWLIMFIATVCLWFVFIRHIYLMLTATGTATIDMFTYLICILLFAAAILLYWQVFNYLMYGKKSRRQAFPDPPPERVAALYGITSSELARLSLVQKITMCFSDGKYYLILNDGEKDVFLGAFSCPEKESLESKSANGSLST